MADENSEVNRLEGEILLAKGNRARALELLLLAERQAADSAFTTESLANAYRIAGETDAAIGQYEELLAHPGRSLGYEPQQNFLAAYYQLGRLYQAKGEKEKALKVAKQLLQLWKEADPDLPLLRETLKLKDDLRKG